MNLPPQWAIESPLYFVIIGLPTGRKQLAFTRKHLLRYHFPSVPHINSLPLEQQSFFLHAAFEDIAIIRREQLHSQKYIIKLMS